MKKNKIISLRIDKELLFKIIKKSTIEKRTISNTIRVILENYFEGPF